MYNVVTMAIFNGQQKLKYIFPHRFRVQSIRSFLKNLKKIFLQILKYQIQTVFSMQLKNKF